MKPYPAKAPDLKLVFHPFVVSSPNQAWISYYISSKVWDEINHRLTDFPGATDGFREWTSNFVPHFTVDVITYP